MGLCEGRTEFLFNPRCRSGVAVARGAADDGGTGRIGGDGGGMVSIEKGRVGMRA